MISTEICAQQSQDLRIQRSQHLLLYDPHSFFSTISGYSIHQSEWFTIARIPTQIHYIDETTMPYSLLGHTEKTGKLLHIYMLAFLSHLSFVSSPQCSFFFLNAGCTSTWEQREDISFLSSFELLLTLDSFNP